MYKVGVVPGKFSPPHRGHLNAILQASTLCERLYVVVSHNFLLEETLYENSPVEPISLKMKARWLSKELESFDTIEVLMLDETDIPVYPKGWEQWANRLKETVPEDIDVIFGGEVAYADEGYTKYFPETKYHMYDVSRTAYPISGTEIRDEPYKHWDYILGSARPYFAKKFLVVGTESCAKTSTVEKLAKVFHTSWAREEGRYYSEKYMGKNEATFEVRDFYEIALEQKQVEDHAIRTANRVTFLDTDATITEYYCNEYLGEVNPKLSSLIEPDKYDYVFVFTPAVKWVDDGLRFLSDEEVRWNNHKKILNTYKAKGYKNIVEIHGDYNQRFNDCIDLVNAALVSDDEFQRVAKEIENKNK